MKLLILGAGGHGFACKEVAEATERYSQIDFLDDNNPIAIGKLAELEHFLPMYDEIFIALGNPSLRKNFVEKAHAKLATLIHTRAYVSPSAKIGAGTIIMPMAVLQTNTKIGKACIISASAVIDHDASIGDYCQINCNATVKSGSCVQAEIKIDYNEVGG